MLVRCREDEERFLLDGDQHLIFAGAAALEIVDFAFSEDEGLSLECPLLEGDPPGHVLDVLHDEIHRHSVISEAGDDDVRINGCGQDEISERFLDEFVVLLEHTHHASASLRSVSLQPPAESDIV